MNITNKGLAKRLALAVVAVAIVPPLAAAGPSPGPGTGAGTVPAQASSLLQTLVVEEKLAHDVYDTLGSVYSIPIIVNTAESEARHHDAVSALLAKRTITDPTAGDPIGFFDDAAVAARYTSLLDAAKASLSQAATTGIEIERGELALLSTIAAVSGLPLDVTNVVQNLRDGDTNHLDAFTRLQTAASTQPPAAAATAIPQFADVIAPPSGRFEVETRLMLARKPVRTDAGVTVRWRVTTETRNRCEVRTHDGSAWVVLTHTGTCQVTGYAPPASPQHLAYRVTRTYRAVATQ